MKFGDIDLAGYQPMPVAYQLRYSILERVRKGQDPLPDIQGREGVKRDVLRALLSGAHPYLVSDEGAGKTRLARSLIKLLPSIPAIRGCPYHDDPLWPAGLLCPRCRASQDPVSEFGIEIIPGEKRFSRIQGNKYTNEAKLIGLKDIQAIAQGKSSADPEVFSGTGILRANRGILLIDELPAIDTKVQVLLHPVLEEKKVILEEYNWEYPLDLILIATGNPEGFSHVNEVPRPLLDRLELIHMDLPGEETEREIMLNRKFVFKDDTPGTGKNEPLFYPIMKNIKRKAIAPWWIIDLVNSAVRYSRKCRWLDKKASIRGTIRALDHTYASAELQNRQVANLQDLSDGLKLALRGRIGLSVHLVDFDSIENNISKTDELSEDLLWNALEDLASQFEMEDGRIGTELEALFCGKVDNLSLGKFPAVAALIKTFKSTGLEKVSDHYNKEEKKLIFQFDSASKKVRKEYEISALDIITNIAWHKGIINEEAIEGIAPKVFCPKQVGWADSGDSLDT